MTQTADPYDDLAAMFLTQPDKPRRGGASTPVAIIEVLAIGHLPVRAGLWLTPYADAVARELGPMALLRLDRDEPILQVLRGSETDSVPPSGGTLRDTIGSIAGSVNGWIVYGGGSATHSELVRSGPDRITILSSADDAAVVAAYQHAKNLVGAAEHEQSKLPTINLAVLGADETSATRVFDRVNRTTTAFLGIEIELSSVIQRMDAAVRSTSYVNFPGEKSPSVSEITKVIDDARRTAATSPSALAAGKAPPTEATERARISPEERDLLHEQPHVAEPPTEVETPASERPAAAAHTSPGTSTQPAAPVASVAPHTEAAASDELDRPLIEFVAYPQPPNVQQTQQQRERAETRQRRPARVIPRPHTELEPKQPGRAREPDDNGKPVPLASHLGDLTPIIPRCPGRERIELAVGRFGRVHLLGRADYFRDMRYVESWVCAHSELLSMACPNVTIDPAARPVCHIFTDQPATLADLHGCDVKLHVLAPVQVNGTTGWYAAPLN